jgi:hypothetical protein
VDNRSLPAKSADELRYAELWRESLAWKPYSPSEMAAAKERERKQKDAELEKTVEPKP